MMLLHFSESFLSLTASGAPVILKRSWLTVQKETQIPAYLLCLQLMWINIFAYGIVSSALSFCYFSLLLFLLFLCSRKDSSFFCILKRAWIRYRNPSLLGKICTCFIHHIHPDTWGGWLPGILSLPRAKTARSCADFRAEPVRFSPEDKGET